MHIFYSCNHTQILWERLKYYIQNSLDLPTLTSQSNIPGFTDSQSEKSIIINHLLLMFKYYILKSRSNKHLSFLQLKIINRFKKVALVFELKMLLVLSRHVFNEREAA